MKKAATLNVCKLFCKPILIQYFFFCILNAWIINPEIIYAQPTKKTAETFCNPINIQYNFQLSGTPRREAADPVIVFYENKYWLFASKQRGYWYSADMVNWNFVMPQGLPLHIDAPSVSIINNKMCYTTGGDSGTYTTANPLEGKWKNISHYAPGCWDPAVFQDDDGKVYIYEGCSNNAALRYNELDSNSFLPLTSKTPVIHADTEHHGWEIPGDNNDGRYQEKASSYGKAPWIEASFMNKINGKYYWQYSAPGTQYKTYGDGVYISDKPTGPFIYQLYSPFSFKPTGFITGAGHSCTYADAFGKYWHISSGTVSVRDIFERRLVIYPAGVLADGQLVVNTYLGDYPQYAPGFAKNHLTGNRVPWTLLSYNKPAKASSTLTKASQRFDIKNAFDENIQTWWSAASGDNGEWLSVDLEKICRVNAIQVNFADQNCKPDKPLVDDGYEYKIEASADGKLWRTIINRSEPLDAPHDYIELNKPVNARYLRIINLHYPAKGCFSLFDFRVFGLAPGNPPAQITPVHVVRDAQQRHTAHVSWKAVPDADFYIIRYGIAPDKLFSNYQVYEGNDFDINALNTDADYYFTVDAVNASGIAYGKNPDLKDKK